MSTVSLVTGGNRGIGREVCRQLAELGHVVVVPVAGWDHAWERALDLAWDAFCAGTTPVGAVVIDAVARPARADERRQRRQPSQRARPPPTPP